MMQNPIFLSTLAHLSRFLGIFNKFLPIYKDIKPVASHIPEYLNKLANLNFQFRENGKKYIDSVKNENYKTSNNQPTFFQ